jgi:hypothetical protein
MRRKEHWFRRAKLVRLMISGKPAGRDPAIGLTGEADRSL